MEDAEVLTVKSMQCSDFDLKLSGDQGQGYLVELLNSPDGRRTEPQSMTLPKDIANQIALVRSRRGNRRDHRRLGTILYDALFPSPIREHWVSALGGVGVDKILRLRLDVRAFELTSIPWELIHDRRDFVAMSARTPIVRYIHNQPRLRPVASTAVVNVLIASATPRNMPLLPGVAEEMRRLRKTLTAMTDTGKVGRFDVLQHASIEALKQKLNGSYQVMHFMGHGIFRDNRAYLVLEDQRNEAVCYEAETIGDVLRNNDIRLLLLNACDTAIQSAEESTFGIAHAAHAAGVPAVIAMQQAILDRAATEFASGFYQSLGAKEALERCLAEGRLATRIKLGPDVAEWAIPILFNNAEPRSLCSLWSEDRRRLGREKQIQSTVIVANGATAPIVGRNVGRDVNMINLGRVSTDQDD